MPDFTITRLTAMTKTQPTKDGVRLVGRFNMNCRGILIIGCVLLKADDDTFKANGPRGQNRHGANVSTHLADRELQRAVTEEAVAIWRQACRMPGGKYERNER